MLGATEFENKYVLALFLNISTTSLGPERNPPEAPPIDFPKVDEMKSIFPCSPNIYGVPLPVFPIKPAEWHSSINMKASYFWANSYILSRGAISPSILNTPSVTIHLDLASWWVLSNYSSSAMFMWLYRDFFALHNLIPSIIDAWLRESLMRAS